MMLLFLVEEQLFTFFHDFKEVNIDLGLDVFTSISCLSIDQQYTIEGGASGNTTVRRVAYEIADGYCTVGDRVYKVLQNGDVDFGIQVYTKSKLIYASGEETFTKYVYDIKGFSLYEYLVDRYDDVTRLDHYDDERYYISVLAMDCWFDPINQDCEECPSTSPNYVCDSIKPYAFSIYSAKDYGFLACVRGEPLRDNMPIEYVQGYADGKYRSDCNCEEIGWVVIDFLAIPSEWLEDARGEGYEVRSDVDDLDVVMVCPGSHSEVTALCDLHFVTNKLYTLWEEQVFAEWVDHEVLSSVFEGGE